jgi:hypothetical protein
MMNKAVNSSHIAGNEEKPNSEEESSSPGGARYND